MTDKKRQAMKEAITELRKAAGLIMDAQHFFVDYSETKSDTYERLATAWANVTRAVQELEFRFRA